SLAHAQWQYFNPAALPNGNGASLLQTTVMGSTGTNTLYNNLWLYGTATSNDWTTTKLIDGISIDGSFQTPLTSRSWWRRDPYNNIQSWGDADQTYMTINQGNVGIGVNPAHRLHVRAVDEISSALRLDAGKFSMGGSARFEIDAVGIVGGRFLVSENGNIGLGTITPDAKLDVFANNPNADNLILSANYSEQYRWRFRTIDRGNAIDLDITASDGSDVQETVLKLSRSNSGRPEFALNENWLVANNGNIGVGTTSPNQKLTVNGTIYGKEVKVDLQVPGPDYVFEPTYQLPSLTEIENYIKANKHLPEVPSAKEMETNGINLSEMNMLLLKKVEELTLHLIELKKEINDLKNK
ncbi:MAG: hypothetical protein EBR30_13115, partial [Cytophagia bacterium]|nr:hypothetical protein [Cytophagia bacterium]